MFFAGFFLSFGSNPLQSLLRRILRRSINTKIMKTRPYLYRFSAAIFALFALVSCSLLKVSVSTGDPLPKEDMNTRVMTRGFYYDMASEIAATADSIAQDAPMPIRIAATRWKIRSTRAGVTAAMQGIPDVALADLWILCRRSSDQFTALPDSLLFGEKSYMARNTAIRLEKRIEDLAKEVLSAEGYKLMRTFVGNYMIENPVSEADNTSANTTLAWLQFLKANDHEHVYNTGTIAEVLADVNDRFSGQTQQISNSLGWSKEIIELQLSQDSIRSQIEGQLDTLEQHFNRIVIVAEHLPEISDKALAEMGKQLEVALQGVDASIDHVFEDATRQRIALEHYVTKERKQFTEDLRSSANELVQSTLDQIPAMVGKMILYIVLGVLLLLGVPFALGFWLGGVRQRSKDRKQAK